MTVKQLMKFLSKQDPKAIVVASIDEEGNGYREVGGIWAGAYEGGDVGLSELTPADKRAGYDEQDVLDYGRKAVILQ